MKSRERVRQYGEVFTPPWLVEEMLDKLPTQNWWYDKTFLDNSCGDGNFLVAILARKLQRKHVPLFALKTIYGADIMHDDVQECRQRLLQTLEDFGVRVTEAHCQVVLTNIVWLDTKKYPKGSLDYDFSFEYEPSKREVERLFNDYLKSKRVA